MAKLQQITQLFLAADYILRFVIYDATETTVLDASAMTLSWMLKKTLGNADADALLHKTVGSGIVVTGAYNANPSLNTQEVRVTVSASDTIPLSPRVAAHELKRMDIGLETPFTYGPCNLVRGVHRT